MLAWWRRRREQRVVQQKLMVRCVLYERPFITALEISNATHLWPADVYAALAGMERDGLVRSEWEGNAPYVAGEPRRRLYFIP